MWHKIWIFQMMGMRWGNRANCAFWVRNHLVDRSTDWEFFLFFHLRKPFVWEDTSFQIWLVCLAWSFLLKLFLILVRGEALLSSQNSRLDEYRWAGKRLELLMGHKLRAGDLLRLSSLAAGCSKPLPGLHSLWPRWMEGYGQVRLTPEQILPVVKMRERRRAEAASRTFCHFQNLLPSPTCDYFTEQNRVASSQPGSQDESHISGTGQGQMLLARMVSAGDPHSLGSMEGERIPG